MAILQIFFHGFFSFLNGRIDKVREYFGEGVAFYFGFLDAFTWSLIFPSVIGVIHNLCTRGPSQAPQSPPEAEAEILPEETPEEMAETLQTLPASSMFTTHLFFCLLYMLWAFGFMEVSFARQVAPSRDRFFFQTTR